MRHAKAAGGFPDHARPLAKSGRFQAGIMGGEISRSVGRIGQLFVSDANRTLQTVQALQLGGLEVAETSVEPSLYSAGGDDVVTLLRTLAVADVVMVLAHEPTMSAVAYQLWDRVGEAGFASGFPTAGAAVLRYEGAWADLPLDSLSLERFIAPPRF